MRAPLLTWLVLFVLAGSAMGADHSLSARERAVLMREIRDQMDASQPPAGTELYQRYFDAFPHSFAELGEVLVSDRYREILLRPGDKWDYMLAYITPMCRSYDWVDHRRYMRKLLRIGVEANNWGGYDKDPVKYIYPGDIYVRLIWRYECETSTEESSRELRSVIYSLVPEFNDAELEAIYNSLSWGGGDGDPGQRYPFDWFLEGICSRYPNRCELTRMLHERYVKNLYDDPRPH